MKRRIGCIVLAFVLTMTLCLYGCGSKETPAEDFSYEMVDGEITITGYHGTARSLVIPKSINGRPVTCIGEYAFQDYDMVSVVLPEGLKEIDDYAFSGCSTLEKINLPDSLQRLGVGAFVPCSSLKELRIPDNFPGFSLNSIMKAEGWVDVLDCGVRRSTVLSIKNGSPAHEQILKYEAKGLIQWEGITYVLR